MKKNPDVESLDSILAALYECMSFEADHEPDYQRFRLLFSPGANVLPPSDDNINVSAVSVDDFIETSKSTLRSSTNISASGFTEREIHRISHRFASIVQVFSTYECEITRDDELISSRGVNALQLIWQSQRWWIVSLVWDDESPSTPLPEEYLT